MNTYKNMAMSYTDTDKEFIKILNKYISTLKRRTNKYKEDFVWVTKTIYNFMSEEQRISLYNHYSGLRVYIVDIDFRNNKSKTWLLKSDGKLEIQNDKIC